jgi:drug/metabolite transporter (DMT)-like permease
LLNARVVFDGDRGCANKPACRLSGFVVTLATFFLVILAALIHASWNLLAKKAGGGAAFVFLNSVVIAAIYTPVLTVWFWWHPIALTDITAMQWFFIALSAAIHIAYYFALQRGYRNADYGVVYPIARGTGPLITSVVAIAFLGETVTWLSGLGIVAIIVGIFVLAGGIRALNADGARGRAGVRWGVTTGAFIAAYTVADGYAVKHLALSPLVLTYFSNVMRVGLLSPVLLTHRNEIRSEWTRTWKYLVVIGAISPLAYLLVLYAMQTAPISHVAPLREISMLFAAFFGAKLLGEERFGEKLLGAALMVLGVVGLLWH